MLRFKITRADDATIVELDGELAELAQDSLLAMWTAIGLSHRLEFHCDKLGPVSSIGVKHWLHYLRSMGAERDIEFHSCSVDFIEYVNMIPSFIGNGRIVSFVAPIACASCKRSDLVVMTANEALAEPAFGTHLCLRCGTPMDPSVDPVDYKFFLDSARKT